MIVDRPALRPDQLNPALTSDVVNGATVLNGISARYPEAISLAAGWPPEEPLEVDDVDRYLRRFVEHLSTARGLTAEEVRRQLFQYGPSAGFVRELVADYLAAEEDLEVDPRAVLLTSGCQEAMAVSLLTLSRAPGDVALVQSPCYFGFAGAAELLGIETEPVPEGPDGLQPTAVAAAARRVRERGRRPRVLYVIPDYANPSGHTLDAAARDELCATAAAEELFLLEDSAYRSFPLDQDPPPSLKSCDRYGRVIHLGSFAKTCFPGARIGYLVADQPVGGDPGGQYLAEHMAQAKSMLSINTSSLGQAVIGGMLLSGEFASRRHHSARVDTIRARMSELLRQLDLQLGPLRLLHPGIAWSRPAGGFFVTVTLPFDLGPTEVEESASRFGVVWTPVGLFGSIGRRQMRLASSYTTPATIATAVGRLVAFIRHRLDA